MLLIKCSKDIDFMNNFNDKETTENTDLKDDKLLFLNGKEQLKYLRGKRDYQRKKNKVRPVKKWTPTFGQSFKCLLPFLAKA